VAKILAVDDEPQILTALSRGLGRVGHEVIVANPTELYGTKRGRRRKKRNDKIDAEYLARVGRVDPWLLYPIRHRGEEAQAELALIQNDIASYAHEASEMFAEGAPLGKALGMAMLYPEVIQIVTLQKTGIATVDDLKGKRVAVGAPGSGTEANARQILEVHEITYRDITEHFLPFGEAVDALRDGRIDAAFLTAGIPTAAVIDLDATEKPKLT
jgi:ABC-type amino acid transport substrate-binding protein